MKKAFAIIGVVFCAVIIIGTPLFFSATPTGKALWNNCFIMCRKQTTTQIIKHAKRLRTLAEQ